MHPSASAASPASLNGPGFSWAKIFLIGFGFLGISLIWAVYNAYVPVSYTHLTLPTN